MNQSPMGVLATELSRLGIMEALQARRFYSTRIDGVVLSFQCNGQEMGSVFLADVTSVHRQSFTWIKLIKNGNVVRSIPSPTFPLTKNR